MKTAFAILLAVVVMSVGAPGGAAAQQRPLTTEDPETVGTNRVLLEGGVELDKGQSYPAYGLEGDTTHVPMLGISVGVGPNAEVQVDTELLQRLHITKRQPAPLAPLLRITGDHTSSIGDLSV